MIVIFSVLPVSLCHFANFVKFVDFYAQAASTWTAWKQKLTKSEKIAPVVKQSCCCLYT